MEEEIDLVLDVDFLEKEDGLIKVEMLNFPFKYDISTPNQPFVVKINNRIYEGSLEESIYPTLSLQSDPSLSILSNTNLEVILHSVDLLKK